MLLTLFIVNRCYVGLTALCNVYKALMSARLVLSPGLPYRTRLVRTRSINSNCSRPTFACGDKSTRYSFENTLLSMRREYILFKRWKKCPIAGNT